tara:strand:- start:1 stop:564 length:564 start_codon:yes stop_codon:yes gene_type:complete
MSEVVTNLIKSRAGREFLGSKGGIINVASGFYGDSTSTSRGVWQHILTVGIEKKNSNSNIFVVGTFGSLMMGGNHNRGEWCLLRNGSPIFYGNPLGNEQGNTDTQNNIATGKIVVNRNNFGTNRNTCSQGVRFLDTDTQGLSHPQYTLAVRDGNYDGTIYVNRGAILSPDSEDSLGTTNMVVMEIVA